MTTARKPAKVYVGNYYRSPVKLVQPPEYVHPRDFEKVYKNLSQDCFTNNPYFADEAAYENVFVVLDNGSIRPITSHYQYQAWKDEFRPGEFWSFTGDDSTWDNPPQPKLHTA